VSSGKRFAVTGDPVLHSKSPLIFNSLFRELDIDAVYTRLAARKPLEALSLFRKLGLKGMNVTAPFKESIMPFLDSVEEAVSTIGGVNTVVREGDRLRGYNTDYIGVSKSLKNRDVTVDGKKCLVLGAGGAGRAAVYGLLKEKAEVILVNRTYEKAVRAAEELGCLAEKIEMLESLLQEADLFISTLSASVDIIPGKWLPAKLPVFDANYKQSPLSRKAEERGCRVIKGEEWLLNQAIPAYRLFFHEEPEREIPAGLIDSIKQSLLSSDREKTLKNISLVGFMGSGKSVTGRKLAQKMGFSFIDTDKRIEEQAGRTVSEIFAAEGEDGFRSREKAILKALLPLHGNTVFSCGGGVVLDEINRELLKDHSLVLWLYSSVKTTLRRIRKGTRPLLDCGNPAEKARKVLSSRLSAYARSADMIVGSENQAWEVVEKIHEEIRKTFKN
jgi:shikimate dehydrogenase